MQALPYQAVPRTTTTTPHPHDKMTSTIDLTLAEPGTIFRCRDGTLLKFTNRVVGSVQDRQYRFEVVGVTQHSTGSPLEVFRFRDGAFSTDVSGRDIVAVDHSLPEVDLSKCSPNQLVRLRNNSIAKYCSRTIGPNDGRPYKVGPFYYDRSGKTTVACGSQSAFDVVQVLSAFAETPAAPPPPRGIPMETVAVGSRFRRRDGKLTTFVKVDPANKAFPYKCECDGVADTYTDRGFYMSGQTATNPKDLMTPFLVTRDTPITRAEAVSALTKLVAKLKKGDADKAKILLTALK